MGINMLKGIPKILSSELFKVLMDMGHGDEIVISDGNFPAATCAKRLVKCDGHGVPEILEAILKFLPLDQYVEKPAALMGVVPGDPTVPVIWKEYESIIKKYNAGFKGFEYEERFDFYERSKEAFAVVLTGESALYANVILKKGVVKENE